MSFNFEASETKYITLHFKEKAKEFLDSTIVLVHTKLKKNKLNFNIKIIIQFAFILLLTVASTRLLLKKT